MKDFKLGGYYVLLDRTAFFTDDVIVAGDVDGVPAGTVMRVDHIQPNMVCAVKGDGLTLFTSQHDRSKFRPASNNQIAQYRKERAVTLCTR